MACSHWYTPPPCTNTLSLGYWIPSIVIVLAQEALALTGKSEIDHDLRATILINCAECYRQLEEYEMVIDQCDKALELKKASVKAHLRRGLACEKLENLERARGDFKTVIELDPTNHIASAGLIRCAKALQLRQQ